VRASKVCERPSEGGRQWGTAGAAARRDGEALTPSLEHFLDAPICSCETLGHPPFPTAHCPPHGAPSLRPRSESSYTFTPPTLLLEDPAKMARLMQAALSASTSGPCSPRLLDGPGASSSGGLTPRFSRELSGGRAAQAALTISGASGGAGSSTPRFTLSWLGGGSGGGGDAAAASGQGSSEAKQPQLAPDVDAARDAKPAAAAAVRGSPPKPARRSSSGRIEEGGNLVFSTQAKVVGAPFRTAAWSPGASPAMQTSHCSSRAGLALAAPPELGPYTTTASHHNRLVPLNPPMPQGKANKSRLGLSLADATSGGKKAAANMGFAGMKGAHDDAVSDVSGGKDLVSHK
jgi:hypothetical protein